MNQNKLNIGCAKYRQGWVNISGKNVDADIYCDIQQGIPIRTSSVDYVYVDFVNEPVKYVLPVMDEIWRVCKTEAIIEIFAPQDLVLPIQRKGNPKSKYKYHTQTYGEYIQEIQNLGTILK